MHCGLLMESQRLPLTVFLIEDRHACVYLMSSALQHSKHGCRSFRIRKELEEGHADAIIAQPLELLKYCE